MLLDENAPPAIAVEYRVVGPMETFAIRDDVAYVDAFGWLDAAFAELRAAVDETDAQRAGADAALYSSELLEDEYGELVAVIPVTSAARPSGRVEPLELPRGPVFQTTPAA